MHSLSLSPTDVTLAQGGDSAAFTRLVDATRGVVGAITLAIVRDPQASQDVAQEVFLEAWATMRTLRNPESFLPWIRQVSRNLAHEHLRKSGRFGRRHATWDGAERVAGAQARQPAEGCEVNATRAGCGNRNTRDRPAVGKTGESTFPAFGCRTRGQELRPR